MILLNISRLVSLLSVSLRRNFVVTCFSSILTTYSSFYSPFDNIPFCYIYESVLIYVEGNWQIKCLSINLSVSRDALITRHGQKAKPVFQDWVYYICVWTVNEWCLLSGQTPLWNETWLRRPLISALISPTSLRTEERGVWEGSRICRMLMCGRLEMSV